VNKTGERQIITHHPAAVNERKKVMSQRLVWFFVSAVVAVSAPMEASNYQVGGCKPPLTNFPTIQAAVNSVPAGSTIQVCPGVYPEQVTITQPLTLLGARAGNSNRAVIAINPTGGLAPNVTSIIGQGL
jgi:pectin methylesterase-like acyl-CoA thioesterase